MKSLNLVQDTTARLEESEAFVYPETNYDHLPRKLLEPLHYMGQKPELIEKEITSYIKHSWPFPCDLICKGDNIHQRINKRYIKQQARLLTTRKLLLTDKLKAFRSAHDNLAIFNGEGDCISWNDAKYED